MIFCDGRRIPVFRIMRIGSIIIFLAVWFPLSVPLSAQQSRKTILADHAKAGGLMYVYDYKTEAPMTAAPKGYKPFYISHFSRHGARWVASDRLETVHNALEKAAGEKLLSPRGEKLRNGFGAFYETAILHQGELTPIGVDQERTIARRMVKRFPAVFRGKPHAEAKSTTVPRVIISMFSFLEGLEAEVRGIEAERDASESFSPVLRPARSNLALKPGKSPRKTGGTYEDYFRETVDMDGILGRIFSDPGVALERCNINGVTFICHLFDIMNGIGYDAPESFLEGIFTEEDLVDVSRAGWNRLYRLLTRYDGSGSIWPDASAYTLEDIIDKADEDIASGDIQLRLRFSHDSSVLPLAVLMEINGFGRTFHSPQEAFDALPLWEMPMGGGLQLIFFRSRHSKEILVKVLWNESEATLPIPSFSGPYYRWSDFRTFCMDRICEAKKKLSIN